MDEIFVRYRDMPGTVKGFTKEDANGDYNVYINSRLNYEQQQAALQHELAHIRKQHFSGDDIVEIENEASLTRGVVGGELPGRVYRIMSRLADEASVRKSLKKHGT